MSDTVAVPVDLPLTLGAQRASGWESRPISQELRENAAVRIAAGKPLVDGVLGYEELVELCRHRGRTVQVGHTRGERDLVARGLAYAREKRWKWRDPATNRGSVDSANWIAGDRFLALSKQLR